MSAWVDAAIELGEMEDACKKAGISIAEWQLGRQSDFVFDEACRVYDQVADLKITESVRRRAMTGDFRSQALYFQKVRDLVLGAAPRDEPASDAGLIFSAKQAEAMMDACLNLLRGDGPPDAPSSPTSSRPEAPRSCESASGGSGGDPGL